jgi:hypothetical protein
MTTRYLFLLPLLAVAACDGCSSCSGDKKPTQPSATASATASASASGPTLPPALASKLPPRSADPTSNFGDYRNEKHRFRVNIPPLFIADSPSSEGDRQTWRTKDGGAEIVVTGRAGKGDLNADFAERTRGDGEKLVIDSKLRRADWFTVQGTEGGQSFFEKHIYAADRHVVLTIRYKKSTGTTISDLVFQIFDTFRFE